MWCRLCQQDVPASLASETGGLNCPRCNAVLRPGFAPVAASSSGSDPAEGHSQSAEPGDDPLEWPPADATSTPSSTLNLWELEQRLRDIGRLLDSVSPILASAQADLAGEGSAPVWLRLDAAHAPQSRAHLGRKKKRPARRHQPGWLGGAVVFAATMFGTTAFACGGFLVGWSFLAPRQDLWTLGIPILLAGQVALVFAVLVQLARQKAAAPTGTSRGGPKSVRHGSRPRSRQLAVPLRRADLSPAGAPARSASGMPLPEIAARLDQVAARIDQA